MLHYANLKAILVNFNMYNLIRIISEISPQIKTDAVEHIACNSYDLFLHFNGCLIVIKAFDLKLNMIFIQGPYSQKIFIYSCKDFFKTLKGMSFKE